MASPRTYRQLNFIENNIALALLTIAIIIVDRTVKFYITQHLKLGESIKILGTFFQITRVENSGAAFGILQGWSMFFIFASLVVFGLIIFYYQKIITNKFLVFTAAFILGGTIGNLLDRLFFGHVIDYLNFILWPTFNISDMALSTGAILLAIYLFKNNKENEEEETTKNRIDFARY